MSDDRSFDVKAKLSELRDEVGELRQRKQRGELSGGQVEHLQRRERQLDKLIEDMRRAEKRAELENRRKAGDPAVKVYGPPGASANPLLTSTRDGALAEIDRYSRRGDLSSEAADRLDTLVREKDQTGVDAAYVAAVSSDEYRTAFAKLLAHPFDAHLRWTPQEAESVHTVQRVSQQRAMQEGLTTAGGFGVPTVVDPTIMLNSDGALNPIRELARVETISTDKWQGVAGSVTASFAAELTEVGDGTPTLAGPQVQTEKAHAFVPYSIELEGDYENLTRELGKALADARDVLEAQKFLTGLAASSEPVGILSTSGALTTSQRVLTNTTANVQIADVYSLKQALPARWVANGTWTVHPSIVDTFNRFVGGGSTEPPVVENGQILRRPYREWSTMVNTTTSGSKIAVFTDFKSSFLIADRVGLSIEIVPHVLGGSQRPIGARGLYAWWRVGSGVLVPNAARYLEVK